MRANHIATLLDDFGNEVNDHQAKTTVLWRAFKQRLSTSSPIYEAFNFEALLSKYEGLQDLETSFSKEEIDEVIAHMPADKAPGPDGFNGAFIKACWSIISYYFYRLIQDFHQVRVNIQSVNNSFITLIPKKDNPATPNDF